MSYHTCLGIGKGCKRLAGDNLIILPLAKVGASSTMFCNVSFHSFPIKHVSYLLILGSKDHP